MKADIIENAIEYVNKLFRNNTDGHDAAHSIRVYHNAVYIAKKEQNCNKEIVALAAILHDADDYKLFKTQNNQNAVSFLKKYMVPAETIDHIINIINGVSFSKNKDKSSTSLEGKIVQDADRLDAIGAIGIARTFAYGGKHGRTLSESVQHFYDKLLLLKDMMNTETAKQLAASRHEYLVTFLNELDKELGVEEKKCDCNDNRT